MREKVTGEKFPRTMSWKLQDTNKKNKDWGVADVMRGEIKGKKEGAWGRRWQERGFRGRYPAPTSEKKERNSSPAEKANAVFLPGVDTFWEKWGEKQTSMELDRAKKTAMRGRVDQKDTKSKKKAGIVPSCPPDKFLVSNFYFWANFLLRQSTSSE